MPTASSSWSAARIVADRHARRARRARRAVRAARRAAVRGRRGRARYRACGVACARCSFSCWLRFCRRMRKPSRSAPSASPSPTSSARSGAARRRRRAQAGAGQYRDPLRSAEKRRRGRLSRVHRHHRARDPQEPRRASICAAEPEAAAARARGFRAAGLQQQLRAGHAAAVSERISDLATDGPRRASVCRMSFSAGATAGRASSRPTVCRKRRAAWTMASRMKRSPPASST